MSEIGNINNTTQPIKLQTKEPREARNIVPADSGAAGESVRPDEAVNIKVVSSSASPQLADEKKDPLVKAAELLEQFMPTEDTAPNTRLRIDRDESSGNFIYQSIDEESGEVIRQFPTEEILKVLSFYRELEGIAVDDSV